MHNTLTAPVFTYLFIEVHRRRTGSKHLLVSDIRFFLKTTILQIITVAESIRHIHSDVSNSRYSLIKVIDG